MCSYILVRCSIVGAPWCADFGAWFYFGVTFYFGALFYLMSHSICVRRSMLVFRLCWCVVLLMCRSIVERRFILVCRSIFAQRSILVCRSISAPRLFYFGHEGQRRRTEEHVPDVECGVDGAMVLESPVRRGVGEVVRRGQEPCGGSIPELNNTIY